MFNASNKGLRCQICTGCGRCGVTAGDGQKDIGIRVLTQESLIETARAKEKGIPLPEDKRLAAADIGTTTIAMQLYRADGSVEDRYVSVNPQTVYGADVLSRIEAARDPSQAAKMQRMVREELRKGIQRFRGRLKRGETLRLTVAANTTMTYLLMGWDPAELGTAPFAASHLQGADLELDGVPCLILPSFSAFVGGDIFAGCIASGMAGQEKVTLLIDLGTNGEMMLGNARKRLACATAAGPAFEGGVNRGIWGADMVKFLAILRKERIVDETGLLKGQYFENGIRIGNVNVTQQAVRNVQLAKAAIAAGIEILLNRYGIGYDTVDRVVLAGGFGYYLRPGDAVQIGLLPETFAAKTVSGGNTALAGAMLTGRRWLCSDRESVRRELEQYRRNTSVINLAAEEGFAQRYLQSISL